MVATINRHDVKDHIDRHDAVLIEVLPREKFKEFHLPGAVNVPLDDTFKEAIRQVVPSKSRPVILYCANEQCTASTEAAKKMDQMGYTHVLEYEGGKEDWKNAGYPVQSETDATMM